MVLARQQPLALKNDSDICEAYIMGSGECGQLGLGLETFEKSRPARLNQFKVAQVCAGGLATLVVDDEGKVWSWGCNDQGCLGRVTSHDSDLEFEPALAQGLESLYSSSKIVKICQGDSLSVLLTSQGRVWAAGTFRDDNGIFGFGVGVKQQDTFKLLPIKDIVDVAVGTNHVIACDKDGKVWTWGSGEHGELGRRILHRHRIQSSLEPRKLGVRKSFVKVFAGSHHGFMVTKDKREVWAWGLNNYGQLGTGDLVNRPEPVKVKLDLPQGVTVESCAGGMHHSSILTSDGKVYMFGRNDSFQLGLQHLDSNPLGKDGPYPCPTPLDVPPMKLVSCGSAFTMSVTEDEELWAWGFNEMGQLGLEDGTVEDPEQVELRGRKCYWVSCGGQHTVMMIRPKEEVAPSAP